MFQDPVTLGITGVLCVTATIMSMHQVRQVALVSLGATRAARRATTPPVESVESDDEKHGSDFFSCSSGGPRACPRRPPSDSDLTNASDAQNTTQPHWRDPSRTDLDAPVPVHAARAPAVHHPHPVHGPRVRGVQLDLAAGPLGGDLPGHHPRLLRELGDLQLPRALPGVRRRRRERRQPRGRTRG